MASKGGPKRGLPTYEAVNGVVNRLFSATAGGPRKVPRKVVDNLRRGGEVAGKKLKWVVGHGWFAPGNDGARLATLAALHDLLEDIRPGLGSLVIPVGWNSRRGPNAYAIRVYEDEALHRQEVTRVAGMAEESEGG
jgi:hypothetical protein